MTEEKTIKDYIFSNITMAFILFINAFPFALIKLPIWASIILIILCYVHPPLTAIFWVWGLIAAIIGPQTFLPIFFYVVFVIIYIPYFIFVYIPSVRGIQI